MTDIGDEINRELLGLWYEPKTDGSSKRLRMPRVYPRFRSGGFLFVGLNPSFSVPAFREFVPDPSFDPEAFYAWRSDPTQFDVARAIEIETAAIDTYRHYALFHSIVARLETTTGTDIRWQHLDLFALRVTKDDDLAPLVLKTKTSRFELSRLNDFGRRQLDFSVRAIKRIMPEMIIVPNANASRLLDGRLKATLNATDGYHEAVVGDRIVPLFFSGSWTGGGMDEYSLQYLQARIDTVALRMCRRNK